MYSPASEDGGSRSEGSSDSKSSLDVASHDAQSTQHSHHSHSHHVHHHEAHHMFGHLGPALAALRKKRKKFSSSRSSTPAMTSSTNTNPPDSSTIHSVATVLASKVCSKKQLQRASSVPTRGPEITPQSSITSRRHEVIQSQQPSFDVIEVASISEQQSEPLLRRTLFYENVVTIILRARI